MVYYCRTSLAQEKYRRVLLAIHHVFRWWIKGEEAKYLAQSLNPTITELNPRSQSLQQNESAHERER